ncbi:MAG: pseudouridine synthase [Candidatus Cloacimonas sp.]
MKDGKTIRLNRFLAECGQGSRRKVEELIIAGKIGINGVIVQDLGRQINPATDIVTLNGKQIKPVSDKIYLMLNKPRGYIVTQSDELGRKTVYSLLPRKAKELSYAGRLDKDSEGLLLFTNDTALINLLTYPENKVEKVYRADINRSLTDTELNILRKGVEIESGKTKSAGVYVKSRSADGMSLKIVITEGKKRQIRQMIEAVGAEVKYLKRLQFGPLKLKDLPVGRWRLLEPAEVKSLLYLKRKDNR